MKTHNRKVAQGWTKHTEQVISFNDEYPFLLGSETSLKQLNEWAGQEFSMIRFRPNLIIRGSPKPFAEDHWKSIRIGEIKFEVTKRVSC